MRRCELRFGLLGPPVLYDRLSYGVSYEPSPGAPDAASLRASGPVASRRVTGKAGESGAGVPARDVRSIGSPKVRALLAALLLEPGRVVSVEVLKDALWGGAPPVSARASLHNHVTRLRRLLDDPERLRAVPPGYVLRVDHGELDVHVFDARAAEARAAHARRDWPGVLRSCADALALWRGTPLSGLPADIGGYAFVQRLEQARLLLLEWRYDAELALGGTRLAALVPELTALAAEHPLREAYHRQLMLALHRTGRQAEALAVHRDLRARLVEELGIEPGPAVREAHVEVLRDRCGQARDDSRPEPWPGEEPRVADAGGPAAAGRAGTDDGTGSGSTGDDAAGLASAVDGTASPAAPAPQLCPCTDSGPTATGPAAAGHATSGPSVSGSPQDGAARPVPQTPPPAQLPAPPAHFTGRADVRRELRRALTGPPASVPAVAVISGMAGVGKSALALHVAHELRELFTDGQLYVNLHGATPGVTPLTAAQALTALLRDLGVGPRNIPEHPDAAAALLRSLLAPARLLLVLDDAANAAQVRPLLPAGPGCAVIVTSRSPLTALDGARRFPLAPLTGEDSAALLRAVSGRAGLDAGHPLVELTGRLPLALRVVAARLAARRALTPDVLAGQLADTGSRLHHLEYDDLSVRRSLAVAHDALAAAEREADRDAALALRRIGALDLPTYGASLMARLTGTDERRAEAALDRLVDVALLEETAYGRYAPHDLVRDFARELADADARATHVQSAAPAQSATLVRSATVAQTATHTQAGRAEAAPARTGPTRTAAGDAIPAPDESRTTALHRWADLVALRWYAAVSERALEAIVEPGIDQDDRRRPTAAQPAEHATDVAALAHFESAEQAFAWGETELENIVALVARNADTDDPRTAACLSVLTRLLSPYVQRSGRVAEMEVLGRAGLGAARRLGDPVAEGYALCDLAALHFLTGRQNDSLALTDQALEIWGRLGMVSRIRRCLNNRGLLLEGLGRFAESGETLRRSLAYSRMLNDPYGEAVTRSHLGNLYEHTDPRAAIEQHRRSLAIGDRIGAVIVRHSAHCNIGYAHLALGEPESAARHFEESLRILGGHGDWHGEAQSRLGLVRALRQLGRTERAAEECAELLRRADARADRYTGGLALHQHGLLLREQGRRTEAYDAWRAARAALDGTDEQAVLAELRDLLGDGSDASEAADAADAADAAHAADTAHATDAAVRAGPSGGGPGVVGGWAGAPDGGVLGGSGEPEPPSENPETG
ncbi:BTAD domain-containing putative transcriptional regulator [Streptomyces sp. CSDS2]|uniref:AfsR/SARP family transcriptional regulator n=1 Tax=Streptomyces sp. CSDS2 TaxID=3055051 RepID=UPI0025B0ACD3|nr:BTAD domain-containing putative transcriptional regulator [Streptomyces sp. CSDS2]MDN3262552.1 BTAD domain-containing putative transcriptional regulator [Streptomyces sp. CSDS2]